MKKIYIIICLLLLNVLAIAQNFPTVNYYTTVYTRNGTPVEGINFYPLSGPDYSNSLWYMQNVYPNATILENPTSTYNCHGFAYQVKDVGYPKVWINVTNASFGDNLSNYWMDGSYVQVCNESEADKAWYYVGDHSALTVSSVSGKYESKWGASARVLHAPTYCPYDEPFYRRYYFASTKISGDFSSALCIGTNRNFSARSITGATYTWQCSNNATIVGPNNGSTVTVQGASTGAAWVQVTISTPCSGSLSATTSANFHVGVPVNTPSVSLFSGGQGICFDQYTDYSFYANNGEPGVGYKWGYILNNGSPVTLTSMGGETSPIIIFPQHGSYYVFATPINYCGEGSSTGYYDLYVNPTWEPCYDGFQAFNLSISPNPSKGEISIVLTDEKAVMKSPDKETPTEVILYDVFTKNVARRWLFKGDQTRFTINASSVKKGQYVIQVKKGKYLQNRMVILN